MGWWDFIRGSGYSESSLSSHPGLISELAKMISDDRKPTRPLMLEREDISNSRRRFAAAVGLLVLAAVVVGICALPRLIPLLQQHSEIFKRVRAGLRNARAKGKVLGRPRVAADVERVKALRAGGASWSEVCRETGLSMGTAQRAAVRSSQ